MRFFSLESQNNEWRLESAPALDLEFQIVSAHLAKQVVILPSRQTRPGRGKEKALSPRKSPQTISVPLLSADHTSSDKVVFSSLVYVWQSGSPGPKHCGGFHTVIVNAHTNRTGVQPKFHQNTPPFQDNTFPPSAQMGSLESSRRIIWLVLLMICFFFFL